MEVVCGSRKSVGAVYQAMEEAIPVSIQAVYDKLQGVEPAVAAEWVRYTAREGPAVMAAVAAAAPVVVPMAVPPGGDPTRAEGAVNRPGSAGPPTRRPNCLVPAMRAVTAASAGTPPGVPPGDLARDGAVASAAVKGERLAVLAGLRRVDRRR